MSSAVCDRKIFQVTLELRTSEITPLLNCQLSCRLARQSLPVIPPSTFDSKFMSGSRSDGALQPRDRWCTAHREGGIINVHLIRFLDREAYARRFDTDGQDHHQELLQKRLVEEWRHPVASAEEEARSRINNITNNNNKVRVKIWK